MAKKREEIGSLEKLKGQIMKLDENKQILADRLLEKAIFMDEELQKLQEYIKVNGATEQYQNGANQFGKKKSSEVDVYNAMVKNYASVMKQINDILPEEIGEQDDLESFLTNR